MGCQTSSLANQSPNFFAIENNAFLNSSSSQLSHKNHLPKLMTTRRGLTKKVDWSMTEQDDQIISRLFQKHHLLYKASQLKRQVEFELFVVKEGQVIFQKGEESSYFYIIREGTVAIYGYKGDDKENSDKVLKKGDYFGDHGIENKSLRSATSKALTDCQFMVLTKKKYMKIYQLVNQRYHPNILADLECIPLFSLIRKSRKRDLAMLITIQKYCKNQTLFLAGEDANCMYIIRKGRLKLIISKEVEVVMNAWQTFGENCLTDPKAKRKAACICMEDNTILYCINKTDFAKVIDSEEQSDIISNLKMKWALTQHNALKLNTGILNKIYQIKEIHYYQQNEEIMPRGSKITSFIIPLEGSIKNSKELEIHGIDYLMGLKFWTRDVVKNQGGYVAFISISKLEKEYQCRIQEIMTECEQGNLALLAYERIKNYTKKLKLSHLNVVQILGNGPLGQTVKVKTSQNLQFSLRTFKKNVVIERNLEEQLCKYIRMSPNLIHPLIPKFHKVYSTTSCIFVLSRLVAGQDLSSLSRRLPKTKETHKLVCHWAACMVWIMQHFHKQGIVWREIKLESFKVDMEGYLNLVDCMYLEQPQKIFESEDYAIGNITFGSPLYMPPQTLKHGVYGEWSDYWAFGVILYKLLVGGFPYGEQIKQQFQTMSKSEISSYLLKRIDSQPISYPSDLNPTAKKLLSMLLTSAESRKAMNINKIKSSTFFRDYEWSLLYKRGFQNVIDSAKLKLRLREDIEPLKFQTYRCSQDFVKPSKKFYFEVDQKIS